MSTEELICFIEDLWSEIIDNSVNLKGCYDFSFQKGIKLYDLEKIFDKYVDLLKRREGE